MDQGKAILKSTIRQFREKMMRQPDFLIRRHSVSWRTILFDNYSMKERYLSQLNQSGQVKQQAGIRP